MTLYCDIDFVGDFRRFLNDTDFSDADIASFCWLILFKIEQGRLKVDDVRHQFIAYILEEFKEDKVVDFKKSSRKVNLLKKLEVSWEEGGVATVFSFLIKNRPFPVPKNAMSVTVF